VSFDAITFRVASQRTFIVVVYFVIESVRKLLDTSSRILTLLGSFLPEFNQYLAIYIFSDF